MCEPGLVERFRGDRELRVESIDLLLDLSRLLLLVGNGVAERRNRTEQEYDRKNKRYRCASAIAQSTASCVIGRSSQPPHPITYRPIGPTRDTRHRG